jgi:hypothetical protein
MSGTARFARKIGAFLPIVIADNYMQLDGDVPDNSDRITVKQLVSGLTVGSLVKVNERELRRVSDILEEDRIVIFDAKLLQSYADKDRVIHHSVPIQMYGDVNPLVVDSVVDPDLPRLKRTTDLGFGPILVKGEHYLYTGDKIAILRNDKNLGSLYEIEVTRADRMDVSGLKVTQIYLGSNIFDPEDLLVDGYVMYLRAYPAYSSKRLKIPVTPNTSIPTGPFLVDWASGSLREGDAPVEVHTLRGYPSGQAAALVDTTVDKNYLVTKAPIHRSSMLTWDLIHGSLNYRPGWSSAVADSDGRFAVSVILIPNLTPPFEWVLPVKPTVDITLLYRFYPNDQVSVNLAAGVVTNVVLNVPNGPNVQRLEIAFKGAVSSETLFGGFMVRGYYVEELEYDLVARVADRFSWASSGVLVKPMFKSILDLQLYTDSGSMNSGVLFAEKGT